MKELLAQILRESRTQDGNAFLHDNMDKLRFFLEGEGEKHDDATLIKLFRAFTFALSK